MKTNKFIICILLLFLFVFLLLSFSAFADDDVSSSSVVSSTETSFTIPTSTISTSTSATSISVTSKATTLKDYDNKIDTVVSRLDLLITISLFVIGCGCAIFVCYLLYKCIHNFMTY